VDASGNAVLAGSWSVVPSGTDAAAATYPFRLSRSAGASDYAEQARVMSMLLGELADSITHELVARR
jgi:hypothetical protein